MAKKFKSTVQITSEKKFNSPYDFKQIAYDERSSSFISAGSSYGVGKRTPVGRSGSAKNESVIPVGKDYNQSFTNKPAKDLHEA